MINGGVLVSDFLGFGNGFRRLNNHYLKFDHFLSSNYLYI